MTANNTNLPPPGVKMVLRVDPNKGTNQVKFTVSVGGHRYSYIKNSGEKLVEGLTKLNDNLEEQRTKFKSKANEILGSNEPS